MSDAELQGKFTAQIATISGDLASYPGLTAAMLTEAGAERDDFGDKLLNKEQTRTADQAATVAKDASRVFVEKRMRSFRDLTRANGVAADKEAALGMPAAESGAPSAATVPIATVDTSKRLQHRIDFLDAAAGGNKRRPKGVVGAEIWKKIDGPPPGSDKDCTFVTLDANTPHVVEYDAEHAGKMVHYMLRWQFRDGSKSAWGETVSATITG
jgi:hypothetical protein